MNLKPFVVPLAVVLAAIPTSTAFAQEPERETLRPNRPLLLTGAAVIAGSYVPPVVVAATSDRPADKNLFIPVAGPWLDLAERGGCGPNPCETEAVYKTLLVTTGIAHLVGSGLVISSFIVPEERMRRAATNDKPIVVPTQMGKGGVGLSLIGTF
jgi:hypothetical protein